MKVTDIVSKVNEQLAGELLTYNELLIFLDETIDDINSELDTVFPTFTEFTQANYPDIYPDYNFFPDKYLREVVIKGTAYKFYVMDEEGIPTAQMYQYNYQDQLFKMLRDYLEDVPDAYKADHKASVIDLSDVAYKYPDRIVPWVCTNNGCGTTNYGKYCTVCGAAKPTASTWTCSNTACKKINPASHNYCFNCGTAKPTS